MSCTELVIRHANKHDMKAVAGMIVELAAYHKTHELPKTTWQGWFVDLRDGFESESPAFQCVVAEGKKDNKRVIVGYAMYFPIYSSREGRCLMLEDLFVQVNERHRGIGNLLFNTVVKEAYSMGCGRVEFHVAQWNQACSWYEGKGAVNLTSREGRCYWRLSGAALPAAAYGGSEERMPSLARVMEVLIRGASKDDMTAVSEMSTELRHYHNIVGSPENTVRDLQIAGFESDPPAFRCVVAEVKNDNRMSIVGYAVYFPIYSSWQGRSLYLQSVFVKDSERHRGIGNLLFDAVAKEAYSMGCGRVDFHVARWNQARSWYESKGAVNLTDRDGRCYWRLSGAALRASASKGSEK